MDSATAKILAAVTAAVITAAIIIAIVAAAAIAPLIPTAIFSFALAGCRRGRVLRPHQAGRQGDRGDAVHHKGCAQLTTQCAFSLQGLGTSSNKKFWAWSRRRHRAFGKTRGRKLARILHLNRPFRRVGDGLHRARGIGHVMESAKGEELGLR
eukprot:4914420-Pleurochrysis_carterae.AAC.1